MTRDDARTQICDAVEAVLAEHYFTKRMSAMTRRALATLIVSGISTGQLRAALHVLANVPLLAGGRKPTADGLLHELDAAGKWGMYQEGCRPSAVGSRRESEGPS